MLGEGRSGGAGCLGPALGQKTHDDDENINILF